MIVIAFVAAAVINWVATYVQTFLINWVGQRALQDLRVELFEHLQRLSVGFYSRNRAGVLISRLTNDVQALDQLVTEGISTLFSATLTLARHGGDPGAARRRAGDDHLPHLPGAARGERGLQARLGGRVPRSRARRSRRSRRTSRRRSPGVRVVRAFGQEPRHQHRFAELNDEHREANMKTVYLNAAYFPAVELLSAVATAAILLYGGNQVVDGAVTIGVLATFVFYLQSFFDPIQSLSQLYTTYQAGMAALDKIFELLDEEPDIADRDGRDRAAARARRDPLRRRDVLLRRRGARARPRDAARAARADARARGRDRRRQVHAREARRALLRPERGTGADRRPRPARRDRALAALAARDRAAGELPVLGHDPRQHRASAGRTRPTRT